MLDLDDARVEDGCEMTLDVGDAAPGALVRLSGRLLDDAPFAGDEPLAGVPVRPGRADRRERRRRALGTRLPAAAGREPPRDRTPRDRSQGDGREG